MPQHVIVYQYTALVLPAFGAAAVLGMARVARAAGAARRLVPVVALAAGVASQMMFGPLANLGMATSVHRPQRIVPDSEDRALRPVRERLLRRVPARGAVVAGFEFLPRLAGRDSVHAIHHLLSGHYTYSSKPFPVPRGVVAVLADVRSKQLLRHVNDGTADRWRRLEESNALGPAEAREDLVLDLASTPDTAELVTIGVPVAVNPRATKYGSRLALLGANPAPARARAGDVLDFGALWTRIGSGSELLLEECALVDDSGRMAVYRLRYIGYTRAPVESWPLGVVVRERYRLALPRELPPGRYVLALRVLAAGPILEVLPTEDETSRKASMFTRLLRVDVEAPER
jgi:hypothetical protein